jgi:uncharacterized membrane protein YedE/YeeE
LLVLRPLDVTLLLEQSQSLSFVIKMPLLRSMWNRKSATVFWVQVLAFLSPTYPAWDLTLAFVMGGALLVALPGFQAILKGQLLSKPYCGENFMSPALHTIDAKLVAGGLLFGAGWGLTGMCPGPALVAAVARPSQQVLSFVGAMLMGLWLQGALAGLMAKPSAKAQPA